MSYILILNSGSSSLKAEVFEAKTLSRKISANLERVGAVSSFLVYEQNYKKIKVNFGSGIKNHQRALKELIKILPDNIYRRIILVGHRIVHGGEEFMEPVILSQKIIKKISRYNSFAPLHNPVNLQTAAAALAEFPLARHVGVFDTQFFKDLAEHVYLFAIPVKYYADHGLRKYGFHGLSHENMLRQAQQTFGRKNLNLITCHIGNGVSISAIRHGRAFDTSMGLTPLSGAAMGTRSGDLDPYITLYLLKELKMSPELVYQELNYNSGLKGLCGVSDFRDILFLAGLKVQNYQGNLKRTKKKKALALLALHIYLYNIQRYVASYAALLGKVDAVVFSGGVGQNRPAVRQSIINAVHFCHQPKILTVKADESLLIAQKIHQFRRSKPALVRES